MDIQAIRSKLKLTPLPIRSWFASEDVSLMVNSINQRFNIQDKNQTILPILLARLEAKDIEADYFAGELSEELKLDRDKALGISAEVKRIVLGPIKKELFDIGIDISLLDKFQIPIIKEPILNTAGVEIPKKNDDLKTSLKPSSISLILPVAPAPKPTTLSDVGWSKSSPTGPGIKLTPFPSVPAVPQAVPVPPKAPPAAPAEPAPMILHEDTTFKAAEKNAGFTLSKPGSGAEVHMSQGATQAPTRPAVLEFGGVKAPAAPNKPAATPSSSAVHYTELKLSLSAVPTADTGPRSVSQIGAVVPIPTPPKPPTPTPNVVPVPRPPQKDKPIVKDFL